MRRYGLGRSAADLSSLVVVDLLDLVDLSSVGWRLLDNGAYRFSAKPRSVTILSRSFHITTRKGGKPYMQVTDVEI